jgi:conjugal transfer pilus assembly protein TraU
MKTLRYTLLFFFAFCAQGGSLNAACKGTFFNPVSDPNWNNALPIVILGTPLGGSNSDNPIEMASAPTCMCPSIILQGNPAPGVMMTYWRPYKIVDVTSVPGCSVSLGGLVIIDGFEHNYGSPTDGTAHGLSVRNIQEWDYDLLGILKVMEGLGCKNPSGISLAYDSNLDPTMTGLPNGSTGESEATLFFANIVNLLACAVDSVASLVHWPLSFLPQCHGAFTNAFPYKTRFTEQSGPPAANYKALVGHLQKQTSRFLEWVTIGPTAQCVAHPFYFMMKSQYKINRVWPIKQMDAQTYNVGNPLTLKDVIPVNFPGKEDASFLLWKGMQCCVSIP